MRRRFTTNNGGDTFDINNYLTIEALEDGLQFIFYQAVEYGIDGKGWKLLNANQSSPAIKAGQTISIRAWKFDTALDHKGFTITKECNLKGNCLSLLFGNDEADELDLSGKDYCFQYLFYNCNTIKSVSIDFLPATTLSDSCYRGMFSDCTSLTTAPELPATTLADSCYSGMFAYCTSLTTAPELPATTLASDCYHSMFSDCTSLTTAPELPATTLADNCYESMFNGCTSLTTAPELPATTLADVCYGGMFRGCSKLNYIKMLATDISALNCLSFWVSGVASTGTFVKHPDMRTLPTGTSGIPSGWTVVNYDYGHQGGTGI